MRPAEPSRADHHASSCFRPTTHTARLPPARPRSSPPTLPHSGRARPGPPPRCPPAGARRPRPRRRRPPGRRRAAAGCRARASSRTPSAVTTTIACCEQARSLCGTPSNFPPAFDPNARAAERSFLILLPFALSAPLPAGGGITGRSVGISMSYFAYSACRRSSWRWCGACSRAHACVAQCRRGEWTVGGSRGGHMQWLICEAFGKARARYGREVRHVLVSLAEIARRIASRFPTIRRRRRKRTAASFLAVKLP